MNTYKLVQQDNLEGEQLAYKVTANSLYGQIGEAEFIYDLSARTYKEMDYSESVDWSRRFNN